MGREGLITYNRHLPLREVVEGKLSSEVSRS